MTIIEPGQVYLDANGSGTTYLLIKSVKASEDGERVYAECLCFIDKCFFGREDMQTKHFSSGRYIQMGRWKARFLKWRMRKWAKNPVKLTRGGVQS